MTTETAALAQRLHDKGHELVPDINTLKNYSELPESILGDFRFRESLGVNLEQLWRKDNPPVCIGG
jgi:hypothetical protein